MRTPLLLLALAAGVLSLARGPVVAQVRPIYDRGAAGLTHVLQRLQTTASVLHTGAHPDDEDSAFIAAMARREHARVAYLSLTRGEGGQNLIGPELFEALGVIRSEELLQARRLDGGEQFFTRAIDFGFSKTRAETAGKWTEREVLDDMVRVIRMFRPLVIVARFQGTDADGHGHHQMAGHLTPLAFRAAASPNEFTHHFAEGLRPWQARTLLRGLRAGPIVSAAGELDPVIGRTYAEIAAEGRSQHKSQEMGTIEPRGDVRSYFRMVAAVQPDGTILEPASNDTPAAGRVLDGIDVTIAGVARLAGLPDDALRVELQEVAVAAKRALDDYDALRPEGIVPALTAGLRATRAARTAVARLAADERARTEADFLLAIKEREFSDAIARAAGVVIDALASQETVPQGTSVGVTIRAFYGERAPARVTASNVVAPDGWSVERRAAAPPAAGRGQGPGFGSERAEYAQEFTVSVPANAPPTQPYFLAGPRDGNRYSWAAGAPKAMPFEEGPLVASVTLDVDGTAVVLSKRVDYRVGDRIRGELRRNVNVVPAITVAVDSPLLVVPLGGTASRHRVVVTASSHLAQESTNAAVRLRLPAGWTAAPAEAAVTLPARGRVSTTFTITAPATRVAGRAEIVAEASARGAVYAQDVQTIAYPHIEPHRLYRPAAAVAQVFDVKVAPVRVGYVMGSGDQVPDALVRLGVDVTLVDTETLARGDLSRFDTIVVGVRASEARPDFAAEHARLMDYVSRGGTLIVQYQQTDYVARNLPPYPAAATQGPANPRVTDETATVAMLVPQHPVFTFPNRITAADFDGWVQERNLYSLPSVDPRFTALLETADPGEAPQRGGEVYAEIGKGRYVYTSFAWFRQLPAGVPGAYRQFANLVSLSRAPR
jgi:LmbE family N-acetylglucosaminyl deacetylase